MQAPVVGGVRLPHGNGETIRLARGASLSDFADKINANPASLVTVLLHLGDARTRARQAAAKLARDGAEPHVIAAVSDAADGLDKLHRTLMQGTYYVIPDPAPQAK